MAHEHPRGAGPFVGHQLRYLVGSAHGWLGGVGFAASARRLKARDAWVGWDDARRRAHLHRVVGLCRMLIRPHVACRNLASHVLGRAVRAVGEDFERLYGYRPWLLETFVDETEHTGASLRAANWVRVGESCGRGRNDRTAERLERAIAIKMVVGWRIQLMVRLGREVPELPSELLFSDGELRVLATFARSRELPPPERLGDAVGLVARLGGWLGRTRDPPGAQLMWHGYTQLVPMAFAFELRDEYG